MLRGRLLFPMAVDLARLDTDTTATAGNYDDVFRTLKPGATRSELPTVRLPAQIEMGRWQGQQQLQAGNAPDTRLTCVFHFRDLEAADLVDLATGDALIRVNDRLIAIYDRTGAPALTASVPAGGLFATEVQPGGIGLGGRRNLLVVTFDKRPQGLTANP